MKRPQKLAVMLVPTPPYEICGLSRESLLQEVWGVHYFGTTRTLDQTVAQLRKKIGDSGSHPKSILTVHGVGYRLVE